LQKLDGPTKGAVPNVKIQLKEWYQLRNYNEKTGLPKNDEIKRLGLEDII
ncbi:MAG: aldehyde ferredoxin oxidoreductase C-terminal domain-containing protein, partial [Promethearchaeota archaeon]